MFKKIVKGNMCEVLEYLVVNKQAGTRPGPPVATGTGENLPFCRSHRLTSPPAWESGNLGLPSNCKPLFSSNFN